MSDITEFNSNNKSFNDLLARQQQAETKLKEMQDKAKQFKTLIVHSGLMHADDVLCASVLKTLNPDIQIKRAFKISDEDKNNPDVIICDVGGEYDPSRNLYDHHNPCPVRESDGKPHSAIGLMLKDLDISVPKVMQNDIDTVEHLDNGQRDDYVGSDFEKYFPGGYSLSSLVHVMNPTWDSTQSPDECFNKAVDLLSEQYVKPMLSTRFLEYENGFDLDEFTVSTGHDYVCGITFLEYHSDDDLRKHGEIMDSVFKAYNDASMKSKELAITIVEDALKKSQHDSVVILDKFAPFQDALCKPEVDTLFVVYPAIRGGYNIQCVPTEPDSFDVRCELPDWSDGMPEGCTFEFGKGDPSKTRFLAAFETKEQAIAVADKLVQEYKDVLDKMDEASFNDEYDSIHGKSESIGVNNSGSQTIPTPMKA